VGDHRWLEVLPSAMIPAILGTVAETQIRAQDVDPRKMDLSTTNEYSGVKGQHMSQREMKSTKSSHVETIIQMGLNMEDTSNLFKIAINSYGR